MRILLSTEDLIELVTKHAFTSLVPTAKSADVPGLLPRVKYLKSRIQDLNDQIFSLRNE